MFEKRQTDLWRKERFVDGEIAVMECRYGRDRKVVCDGKPVGEKEKPVFLIVNKPSGIVCTTSDKDHAENIVEFLNYPGQRIYPVGRLDKDSRGLLLMTNQGDIVNKILPRWKCPRERICGSCQSPGDRRIFKADVRRRPH